MLALADLAFRFPGAPDAMAILVERLEIAGPGLTVLTGASGSGKTTLLYLLSGLLAAQQGRIDWDGTDLARLGERERDLWRRRHAGYVFQDFHLFPEASPLSNVLVGSYLRAWSAGGDRARARGLLEGFGVPVAARPAATFSRGEQQRIALARALLHDPAILFADEPTASLDTEAAQAIGALLANLGRDGKTVIAVSHDPALIERAGRVIRMSHGRLEDVPEAAAA